MPVLRVEGQLRLEWSAGEGYRAAGGKPRGFERRLLGRSPMDAIFLTQQIAADSGISHALAAVRAWEKAGDLDVAPNGRRLRDLLHMTSFLHAHLRCFYFQILPDYLPFAAMGDYGGRLNAAARAGTGMKTRGLKWRIESSSHRFSSAERDLLLEHLMLVSHTLGVLQRTMAILGGKFPVVMSIVPGGMSTPLTGDTVVTLDRLFGDVEHVVTDLALEDGLSLLERYPEMGGAGKGLPNYISMGAGTDSATGLFAPGAAMNGRLHTLDLPVTESIERSYYSIAAGTSGSAAPPQEAPDKSTAYSWIKAPRIGGVPVETGPFARLIITQQAGTNSRTAAVEALLEDYLRIPLAESNTTGGRILAMLAETGVIVRRCREILRELEPGEPTAAAGGEAFRVSGEGTGRLESPSGALQHRIILDDGKIVFYDVIAASTWNGGPRDEQEQKGPLETALDTVGGPGDSPEVRLALSRIVHAFAFSAADAVH